MKLKKQTREFIKLVLENELRQEIAIGKTLEEPYVKDLFDAYKDFMMADATGILYLVAQEIVDEFRELLESNEEE